MFFIINLPPDCRETFMDFRRVAFLTIGIVLIGILAGIESNAQTTHPDGLIGKPSGWISAGYASVSVERELPGFDRTRFGAGMVLPATSFFTFDASYALENEDTLYHNYSVGARFRFGDPSKSNSSVNPDGRVARPVLLLAYEGKFPDVETSNYRFYATIETIMPISSRFTFGGGWRYYDEDHPRQVDEFYGILNYFPASYAPGREYENPDGVDGNPSFFLRGGGSSHGFFGQLDIAAPLKPNLTLTLSIRGERIPSPYVRTAILSGHIDYYPGN